jgi:hypothetical protein
MKNIHLLPTNKARLYIHQGKLYDNKKTMHIPDGKQIPHHIYITNSEEIKEGDWVIYKNNFFKIENGDNELFHLSKKIILTDNKDLIKDNVQAISDEFIELFVKNLNCERVEVESMINMVQFTPREFIYKIIIPQETLEEAADSYSSNPIFRMGTPRQDMKRGFELGAKWQAERMYSEEDLREAFRQGQDNMDYSDTYGWDSKLTEQEWFEQFKKK